MTEEEKKMIALRKRAERMKVDFIELSGEDVDPEQAQKVSPSFARQNKLIPVRIENDQLVVAMDNPGDLYLLEQLEIRTDMKIKPVLADSDEIDKALKTVFSDIIPGDVKIPILESEDFKQFSKLIKPQTISWFESILVNALRREASDVHLENHEREIKVRYRIDGVISETTSFPRGMESQIHTLLKSLTGMKLEKRTIPQDGSFDVFLKGRKLTVRVSSLPTRTGERFIMKIMDARQLIRDVEKLGFDTPNLEKVKKLVRHRQGLLIVAGPSGSGISTTLYSLASHISNPKINVITIEDPIEADLDEVNQVEVNPSMGMDYETCLRNVLKHAPDVIMIGRSRTPRVAQLAVEAALAGKLVMTGLYARNSVDSITRLRDFGIESYLLSTALIGIISRRLARRVCPHCAVDLEMTPQIKQEMDKHNVEGPFSLKKGTGCNRCLDTGYKGRLGIYEVLVVSESLRSMILRGSSKARLQEQALRDGMKTLYKDGLEKAAQGLTTYEEIRRILMD